MSNLIDIDIFKMLPPDYYLLSREKIDDLLDKLSDFGAPPCDSCGAACCKVYKVGISYSEKKKFKGMYTSCRTYGSKSGNLKMQHNSTSCILLDDNDKCTVHHEKPYVCKMYDCRIFDLALIPNSLLHGFGRPKCRYLIRPEHADAFNFLRCARVYYITRYIDWDTRNPFRTEPKTLRSLRTLHTKRVKYYNRMRDFMLYSLGDYKRDIPIYTTKSLDYFESRLPNHLDNGKLIVCTI